MTGHTLATGRAATIIKLAFAAGVRINVTVFLIYLSNNKDVLRES